MLEIDFKTRARKLWRYHWQSIETFTESGVPDVILTKDGVTIWVEFKIEKGAGALLRKEQRAWFIRFRRQGLGVARVLSYAVKERKVKVYDCIDEGRIMRIGGKTYWQIKSPPAFTSDMSDLDMTLVQLFNNPCT